MKRKNSSENRISSWILVLIAAALVVLVIFAFAILRKNDSKPASSDNLSVPTALPEGPKDKPEENKEDETIHVQQGEYIVFDLENVDFRFVLAHVSIQAGQPVNLSLSHFVTDEGIRLDEVKSQVETLENNSLFLGRQNVWFSLISEDPVFECNIFIPVLNADKKNVTVHSDLAGVKDMVFDLQDPKGTSSMLTYQAEDIITDGMTYQMQVSRAFEITGDYIYTVENGTESEYYLPSTTKVYAFRVDAVSLWRDEIVIEQAVYKTADGQTFEAMASNIRTMKYSNLLGEKITDQSSGYLFFYAFDPDSHPIAYKGVLDLKIKGSDRWITIQVDLN